MRSPKQGLRWLFAPGVSGVLAARWIFLRALGLIYFAAFYSLAFQIRGLIGPQGILPAKNLLAQLAQAGPMRFWYVPSLLWLGSGDHAVMLLCWAGMTAALLVVANVWPRLSLAICFVCYLSFVAAARDFAGYQSDGMLLEAGFLALFFAPAGAWPGWGRKSIPIRASWFLLLFEWFRIYFQSGAVKLLSGDPQWRHLTAMRGYYQNGPLPTWVGWYAAHMPNWFHWTTALLTLVMELGFVWIVFLGRRARIVCFWIVTVWQAVVILTANYTFLNYLVLVLAFLLLDDGYLRRFVPQRWRAGLVTEPAAKREEEDETSPSILRTDKRVEDAAETEQNESWQAEFGRIWFAVKLAATAVVLTWIFYAATAPMIAMFWKSEPILDGAIAALYPLRVANQYGLFAVMTNNRYEVEFQGSSDGQNWTAYPFRYKTQDVMQRPGIYALYQPRLDWNLWFISLSTWNENAIVPYTEAALLRNDPQVLALFAGDPFAQQPPKYVRAVLWQYWFTSAAEKKATGAWWTRKPLGTFAPTATLVEGRMAWVAEPEIQAPEP